MTYRDDLAAAHARIAALEAELARNNVPITSPLPSQPARRIRFHPPHTWMPMLRVLATAVVGASRAPTLPVVETHNVAAWLALKLVRPLFAIVVVPLYFVLLAIVTVWIAFLFVLITPLLVPVIALVRLRFDGHAPRTWLDGDIDEGRGRELLFMGTMFSWPLALPLLALLGL